MTASLFKCVDYVQYRVTHARAEVIGIYPCRTDIVYCSDVSLCKVNNVYIVAHACAVVGIIVVAEYAHFL